MFKYPNAIYKPIRTGHNKTEPKKLVPCPKCQKIILKRSLNNHLQLHAKQEQNKCEICSKVFWNKYSCLRHKLVDHSSSRSKSLQPHKCEKCGKIFVARSTLKTHQKFNCPKGPTGKRIPCHLCNKPVVPYNYNRHVKSCSGTTDFQCYFCQKEFAQPEGLRMHMLAMHIKEKSLSCQLCSFKSSNSNNIWLHRKRKHSSKVRVPNSFPCYFCGKLFPGPDNVTMHIQGVHLKERPYKCEKCPKRYVNNTALAYHIKTGGRTKESKEQHGLLDTEMECPKCFKIISREGFRGHLQRVHGNEPPKLQKCPTCFKLFRKLAKHMKIHDPTRKKFMCEECGAELSSKCSLNLHKGIHGTRERIQCPQCGVELVPSYYNRHVRRVHGSPEFGCYFCAKPYKTFKSLCTHLRGTHVKEKWGFA